MAKAVIKNFSANKVLILLLVFHLLLLVNLKFTAWPEMVLWPYLINNGWLPYKDIAIAHNPLLLVDLSIFTYLFGSGLSQLKAYTWITILAIDLSLYVVVSELWNKRTAALSILLYSMLQVFYEGNGVWFDLSLALYALMTFYFVRKQKFFYAGLVWAASFYIKQTAFWFLFPIIFSTTIYTFKGKSLQDMDVEAQTQEAMQKMLAFIKSNKLNLLRFIKGAFLVFSIVHVSIWILGFLQEYYYWTVEFGIFTLPRAVGQTKLPSARQFLIAIYPFTVLLGVSLIKKRNDVVYLGLWGLFGLFGSYPRWELFHFQPALPFLATALALLIIRFKKQNKTLFYLAIVYLLIFLVPTSRKFARDWNGGTRFYEPEIKKVANFINNNTRPGDKVFVANTWDHLYAMTNTLPATKPWYPQLPWYMNMTGVQESMIGDLKVSAGELVVVRDYAGTGLSLYRPEKFSEYLDENYKVVKSIDNHKILIEN